MKTSQMWWDEVKASPERLNDWLVKQYRGEVTAYHRIIRFAEQYANEKQHGLLLMIAEQENQHAMWVYDLLAARGLFVQSKDIEEAEQRYWKETLPSIDSLETGAAVAAHAEHMRLERIRVICNDSESPEDIREVFKKILKDEEFHEKAFTWLSNPDALEQTRGDHERGLVALGLAA